jgi:hypothetical protein
MKSARRMLAAISISYHPPCYMVANCSGRQPAGYKNPGEYEGVHLVTSDKNGFPEDGYFVADTEILIKFLGWMLQEK